MIDWSCRVSPVQAELACHEQMAHYGLLWLERGQGELELDFVQHRLTGAQAVFWSPGQICRLNVLQAAGWRLDFGLDTFCQSGLNDALLESLGLFAPAEPLLPLPGSELEELGPVWRWWQDESDALPYQRQMAGTYLRLILLRCGRLRASDGHEVAQGENELWPRFRHLLETRFRQWHQVSDYADALAVTPGHLNDLVKQASGRSAKQVIQERLMLEARRAAWFSDASLKQIAYELGFADPAYFSRLFRRCSGQPFSAFREQVQANP